MSTPPMDTAKSDDSQNDRAEELAERLAEYIEEVEERIEEISGASPSCDSEA